MSRIIAKGAVDQTIYVEILDSTSTTGGRKTGLVFNTASLTGYYVRNGGSATAITLATLAAANSAHSDGGFKEVDATNMPGVYRLDLPDAAVASGADSVVVMLKGATGMAQVSAEIQLTAVNNQDAVRGGMTALPNAAADAAGGLPISDAGGLDLDAQVVTKINAILADTGTDGVVVAAASKTGYSLTPTTGLGNQTADITGSLSGSVGSVTGAVGSVTGAVGSVTGMTASDVAAIKAKTDSLAFTVAGKVDSNVLAIDGVTDAADRLQKVVQGNVFCTVGAASTTTSIVTSAMDPAAAVIDQFKGRIVTFKNDTTTANLRGQSTDITASTALGVLTVTALTTAPASGDTFTIS